MTLIGYMCHNLNGGTFMARLIHVFKQQFLVFLEICMGQKNV